MRILILNPNQITRWNPGHQQFRNTIGRYHNCIYYGPGYKLHKDFNNLNHVPEILTKLKKTVGWKPDLILTYGYRYSMPFTGLGMVKQVAKAHIICDFTPAIPGWRGTINEYMPMLMEHDYDFFFAMSYHVLKFMKSHFKRKETFFLPFGVDHRFFRPIANRQVNNDAYIGWSNHNVLYPLRRSIEEAAKKSKANILIKRIFQQNYVNAMNNTRININTSNAFKTLNMKVFEAMACNRPLITERVQELDDLGFLPWVHYLPYNKLEHTTHIVPEYIISMIEDSCNHSLSQIMMNRISQNAYEKVLDGHTNDHRVKEMTEMLDEHI